MYYIIKDLFSRHWALQNNFISLEHLLPIGFPASRVIPLGPVKQRSTSPGRAIPGLDRTQYRFGVQKRQGSFSMGRESNPDSDCHHRSVLLLGLPIPDIFFTSCLKKLLLYFFMMEQNSSLL
ncbi:hypothetical protein YC2023_113459 [Brassica napus]|uniref:(rape) hypothetical protein n=1 Tax=Brassica napus TaxID=3708 RepID=A0A816IYT1_BRANA|nr:unnamed protein product [Brassica napus]